MPTRLRSPGNLPLTRTICVATILHNQERRSWRLEDQHSPFPWRNLLVDSMRGSSSTWTRIRVNLRHVPEAQRPLQETPDPDDDPTREWRQWRKKKAGEKRWISGWPGLATGGENRFQLLRRNDFELGIGAVAGLFVRSPSAELRRMTESASLHMVVSDFHHQLGSQWFPR
jgi:hypothetical protein